MEPSQLLVTDEAFVSARLGNLVLQNLTCWGLDASPDIDISKRSLAPSLPRSCKDGEVKEKREVALLPGDPVDERDKALSSCRESGKSK